MGHKACLPSYSGRSSNDKPNVKQHMFATWCIVHIRNQWWPEDGVQLVMLCVLRPGLLYLPVYQELQT